MMTKIYNAVGQSKDGALWMYSFGSELEAVGFVDIMKRTKFPKHDAFDITWGVAPTEVCSSVDFAVKDITDWINQINLRTN
jgi:hypothetical protein